MSIIFGAFRRYLRREEAACGTRLRIGFFDDLGLRVRATLEDEFEESFHVVVFIVREVFRFSTFIFFVECCRLFVVSEVERVVRFHAVGGLEIAHPEVCETVGLEINEFVARG